MNVYVIAHVFHERGEELFYPATRQVFKSEAGVLKEYKRLELRDESRNLRILKAQWVDADFDEYVQLKNSIDNEEVAE